MAARRDNSGFVLLLVLLVLVVSGTVLAAAARRSGLEALRAHSAQRDLQLSWGALSCRAAILPHADNLLEAMRTTEEPVVLERRGEITLGGVRFVMILGDESAKANANLLADRKAETGLSLELRDMQSGAAESIDVKLRPSPPTVTKRSPVPIRYYGFDQLLDLKGPEQLAGDPDGEGGNPLRRNLTCWGDGKLNIMRADVPAIRAVMGDLMSDMQIRMFDDIRRNQPQSGKAQAALPLVMQQLQMTRPQLSQVYQRVAGKSTCHSLWVIVADRTRNWYRFYVEDSWQGEAGGQEQRTFAW